MLIFSEDGNLDQVLFFCPCISYASLSVLYFDSFIFFEYFYSGVKKDRMVGFLQQKVTFGSKRSCLYGYLQKDFWYHV